jgi:hypothetical protein
MRYVTELDADTVAFGDGRRVNEDIVVFLARLRQRFP